MTAPTGCPITGILVDSVAVPTAEWLGPCGEAVLADSGIGKAVSPTAL